MGLTRTRFIQADTAKAKIEDPITVLNSNSTEANIDVGFLFNRNLGVSSNVALFWDESGTEFVTAFTSNSGTTDSNITISSYANIRARQFRGNIGPASDIANVYITGSLIPSANISYDLGSSTNRFATLWLSGNTIVVGEESISVANNEWTLTTGGNNIVLGSESTFDKIIAGNLTITTNLTVQGTSTLAASNNVTYQDSIIELHTQANLAPLTGDDGRDIGLKFHYYKTQDEHAFLGWANDTGYLEWYDSGREGVGNVFTGNTYGVFKAGGAQFVNTTPSTSTTTGALKVSGGAGIAGNVYAGNVNATNGTFDFVSGTVTSSSQPNITDIGTLTNLDVAGGSSLTGFTTFTGSGSAEYTVKIVGPDKDKLAITTGEATSIGIGLYSLTNDESNYSNLRLQARSIDFRTGSTASNQNSKVRIDATGNLLINTATTSTSTTTGALVVNGGAGVAGNVYADAFYTTTGMYWSANGTAWTSAGGGATFTSNTVPPTTANVAGDFWYNTDSDILFQYIDDGTNKYWIDISSQTIAANASPSDFSNTNVAAYLQSQNITSANIGSFYNYANTKIGTNSNGNLVVIATTTSTSTTTGALVVAGGAGIAGNVVAGAVYEGTTRVATTGKAIAMSIVFGG